MGMPGYTKLFSSILASTIWREDDKTRIVWITLLAMADKKGLAECSVPGLADLARVSVDDCRVALQKLQQPDPDSRTQEHEGRRIAPAEGGFSILNHSKYRAKLNQDERREYLKIKQAEYRKRKQASTKVNNVSNKSTELTHTEAKADTDTKAIRTKPSAKPSANGVLPEDSRHTRIKAMLQNSYQEQTGADCPWDGGEGAQLKAFLSATPRWLDGQVAQCLANMYASTGFAKGTRPREFLPRLPKYLHGPLNEFNREENGSGKGKSNSEFRKQETAAAVRAGVNKFLRGQTELGNKHVPAATDAKPRDPS